MELFQYCANILPEITLIGKHDITLPFRNIRRISDDYIFYLVAEGEILLEEAGISWHLQKGDCFLMEPGKLQFGTKETRCRLYYIHFRHPRITRRILDEKLWVEEVKSRHYDWLSAIDSGPWPEDQITVCKKFRIEDKSHLATICTLMEHILTRQKKHLEHFNTMCSCEVSELFIEIQRRYVTALLQCKERGMEKIERINMVVLYLHANYKRKLNGTIIEKELSYNFDYLNQLFQKNLHVTIFKMLENIRMEEAKNLLQTGIISIKEIANDVGYSDETYFSKVFKRYTGSTPAKYRRQGQGNNEERNRD